MKRCGKCGMQYGDSAQFCLQDGQALEVDDLHATDPYLGQVILGQFAIEALIGEGGMATIYRARQRDIDRPVAVKILRPEISSVAGVVERLHREARLASRLQSPHVAHVYVTGELPDGRHALAMEYLEGRVLEKEIEENGALAEARVVHILRQLAEALTEAHDLGIVHRDLKPENIMLVRRGSDEEFVKVLDFGIAKQLGPESTSLTGVGLAVGTPLYMSPEAASGAEVTPASDVYSIGILAYEMLSGELPFDGDAPGSVLLKQVHDEPPPLAAKAAAKKTSPGLVALVHRCLAKAPADRPKDGRAFLAALEAALQNPASAAAHSSGLGLAATTPAAIPAVAPAPPASASPTSAEVPLVLERSLGELEQVVPERKSDPSIAPPSSARSDAAATPSRVPARPAAGRDRAWLVAALVAVLAIVGVAVALREPPAEDRHATLLRKAERALDAGRLEGPHGAIALTEIVLTERSDHEGARKLHRKIANTLRGQAREAEEAGRPADALARLALLESLEPSRNVRARMKRLQARIDGGSEVAPSEPRPRGEPRVVALYLQPANVVAGQRVSIVARTAGPRGALDGSSFHVRTAAGGAAVLSASRSSSDTYTTSHTFAVGGRYQVGFAGYWAQITVADAAGGGPAPTAEPEPTPEPAPPEPEPAPEPAPTDEPAPPEPGPAPEPAPTP